MPRLRSLTLSLLAGRHRRPAIALPGGRLRTPRSTTYFEALDAAEPHDAGRRPSPRCRRSASKRCASSSPGPRSPLGRAAPRSPPSTRPTRRAYNWSEYDPVLAEAAAPALAGAADRHLAGAALGDVEPQSAVHHASRPARLRGIHDRGRRVTSARRSRLYSIWNEPNHPAFLMPQWNSNGTPASPRIYRGLYQAGYAGLQAGRPGQPEGPVRRDGADRLRHRQRPARRRARAAARRRAARVPARSAVPERPLPPGRLLRGAADERLRPPRLHQRGRPVLRRPKRTTSRSASLSRLSGALDQAAARARDPGAPADLPHRVRGAELPRTTNSVSRSPSRPNTTRSPNASPGRTRASPPSRSTCSRTTRSAASPARASPAAPSASRRGSSTSTAGRKPLYSAWPVPLTVSRTATACLAVGARASGDRPTKVTVLVQRKGSRAYKMLKTVATDSRGYWALSSTVPAQPGACAGRARRAALRRTADQRLLSGSGRRSAPASAGEGSCGGSAAGRPTIGCMPELPEVEITARLLDRALAGRASSRRWRPASTR